MSHILCVIWAISYGRKIIVHLITFIQQSINYVTSLKLYHHFREALNEERQLRKAKVAERRERRLQEKNLFDDDVVERKKREDLQEDSSVLFAEDEDYDYSYYYYGEGDDYEVYVGGKQKIVWTFRSTHRENCPGLFDPSADAHF